MGWDARNERGVSSVLATIMMVAIVVTLASTTAVFALGIGSFAPAAPQASVSHELVDDGGKRTIAVTLESGNAVRTDRLYVGGSTDLDVGGAPASSTPAQEAHASSLEKFTESAGGNPPQVGIGDTWDAGETIYLDPVGSVDGVTVTIYWNTEPVEGINPGSVEGEHSSELVQFTV